MIRSFVNVIQLGDEELSIAGDVVFGACICIDLIILTPEAGASAGDEGVDLMAWL
jgi:hypothetical protein